MGQKTNPIGNRLGIIRGWDSNWYGGRDYGEKLAEDEKIRKYIFVRLNKASVSNVIIERTLKIIIETTPRREATTRGKILNAPRRITEEKIYIAFLDISLDDNSEVAHSIGSRSLWVLRALIESLSP